MSSSTDGYFQVERQTVSTPSSSGHFVVLVDYATGLTRDGGTEKGTQGGREG